MVGPDSEPMFTPHFGRLVRALIIFGALLLGCISHYHLGLEKEWNGELQQMIDHDMEIMSRQNKLINDLFAYCYKVKDQIINLTPAAEVD